MSKKGELVKLEEWQLRELLGYLRSNPHVDKVVADILEVLIIDRIASR